MCRHGRERPPNGRGQRGWGACPGGGGAAVRNDMRESGFFFFFLERSAGRMCCVPVVCACAPLPLLLSMTHNDVHPNPLPQLLEQGGRDVHASRPGADDGDAEWRLGGGGRIGGAVSARGGRAQGEGEEGAPGEPGEAGEGAIASGEHGSSARAEGASPCAPTRTALCRKERKNCCLLFISPISTNPLLSSLCTLHPPPPPTLLRPHLHTSWTPSARF